MGCHKPDRHVIYILAVALLGCLVSTPAAAVTEIFEVQISDHHDDGQEDEFGEVDLDRGDLYLGIEGIKVGLRFRNVNIPRYAPITRAYIELTCANPYSDPLTLDFQIEASDNPLAMTPGFEQISGRTYYSEKVPWVINYDWQTYLQPHQGPEIKSLVQKVVNRGGWNCGGSMFFMITCNSCNSWTQRRANASEYSFLKSAKLHIEYAVNATQVPVQANTDDMFHNYGATSGRTYDYEYIRIGSAATTTDWFSGYRFTNVNIPQGAVINYAAVKFVAYQNHSAQTGSHVIRGEKRLNAPTFSTADKNVDAVAARAKNAAIPKTSATVTWSTFGDWAANQTYSTPDLTAIIQEIVGQAGWDTSDKSLVLLFGPNGLNPYRHVYARNHSEEKAPVLYVEWGGGTGGGGGCGGAGGGGGVPVMSPSATDIGQTLFQGNPAEDKSFEMMNSGQATLNYTMAVTYNSGSNWFSITPAAATGSIAAGEKKSFTIAYNSTGLSPGLYEATVRFTDPNATNSPQDIRVSLEVKAQGVATCLDAPLYTRSMSSPAALVLLDISDSMNLLTDIFDETDTNTRTPELKSLLQELVDQDAWAPGAAAAFFVEHVSGSGTRWARAYEGNSGSAPLLYVEYQHNGITKTLKQRVSQGADDGIGCPGGSQFGDEVHYFVSYPQNMIIKPPENSCDTGLGLRFQNLTIPKGARIDKAYIQFVPYFTTGDPIRVRVSVQPSPNAPGFSKFTDELALRPRSATTVLWDIPGWTGLTRNSRLNVAKTVIGELVKNPEIAWGFGTWADIGPWAAIPDGSYTIIHAGCKPNTADHQNKLQAAIAASQFQSCTPFSPSISGAKNYFQGQKKDDDLSRTGYEDGEVFQSSECQPKFLIQITDGMGNVDSTIENTRERTHALADAGVNAIGIGFGIRNNEIEQLHAMVEVANARGKAATGDMLYALNPEDEGGNPVPYITSNQNELTDAFKSIMGGLKGVTFFGSAPAASSSTDLGDRVILGSFAAGTWTGELQAIKKAADGSWTSGIWKATENVPAVRSVWTVDGGNTMTAYTDSTLSGDNWLCKKLGDIIHSTPVVVGPPPFFYHFDQYAAFKRDKTLVNKRDSLVYVGSNDGLLHAFSLADGKEKWAFLPRSLQAKLSQAASGPEYDMCSTSYCHKYLLDGSPQVADVYAGFGGGTRKWRTVLVVGQRKGGAAYTALDVTSGQSPDPSNSDPAKHLWEFTDADLGQSWTDPAIERVADATGSTGAAAWGVFFGSGYAVNDNLQPSKEAILYGIQADTGTGLWSNGTGTVSKFKLIAESGSLNYSGLSGGVFAVGEVVRGGTSGAIGTVGAVTVTGGNTGTLTIGNAQKTDFQNGEALIGTLGHLAVVSGTFTVTSGAQKNNALSSPLVVNFSASDHIEDALYTGDLYGNLFRVDNIGKGQTPAVSRLFKFNPYPTSPDVNPIRGKASNAYGNAVGEMWVYFGTGRYETQADVGSSTQQYFLGLKDGITPRATPYTLSDLRPLEARFTTATVNGAALKVRTVSGTNAASEPWALKLFAGQADWGGPTNASGSERVFTKPLVVGGIVFFTTFIPDAASCGPGGETWVFALDYKTGLPPANPVFDLDGDKKFNEKDKVEINGQKVVPLGIRVGRGQGSHPVLHKDTLFVTTSSANLSNPNHPNPQGEVTGLNALLVNIPGKKVKLESWKHN